MHELIKYVFIISSHIWKFDHFKDLTQLLLPMPSMLGKNILMSSHGFHLAVRNVCITASPAWRNWRNRKQSLSSELPRCQIAAPTKIKGSYWQDTVILSHHETFIVSMVYFELVATTERLHCCHNLIKGMGVLKRGAPM